MDAHLWFILGVTAGMFIGWATSLPDRRRAVHETEVKARAEMLERLEDDGCTCKWFTGGAVHWIGCKSDI